MSTDAETAYIRDRIQHYVQRGTFAGMREETRRSGLSSFVFQWLLGAEFRLDWRKQKRELAFVDLLPAVSYPGFLDRELRQFAHEKSALVLPEHRRVDPHYAALRYANKSSSGSLYLTLVQGDVEYALKSGLMVVNDLFAWLNLYHIDYLHQNFGVPEE